MLTAALIAEIDGQLKDIKFEKVKNSIQVVLGTGKTSLARYLTRNLKLKEKGLKDNEIRDLAEKYELTLADPDLIVCKSPEDYLDMYRSNLGSCMDFCHANKTDAAIAKKYNLYCTYFYHYFPRMCGVYIKNGKSTIARCFIIDNKTFSGYVYEKYYDERGTYKGPGELVKKLTALGLTRNNGYVRIEEPFEVPALEMPTGMIGPLPNCDDVYKPFYVSYDKEKNVFIYSGERTAMSREIDNTYNYNHWITTAQCPK